MAPIADLAGDVAVAGAAPLADLAEGVSVEVW